MGPENLSHCVANWENRRAKKLSLQTKTGARQIQPWSFKLRSRDFSAPIQQTTKHIPIGHIDAADALTASAVLVASMERAAFSPGLAACAGILQLL